MRRNKIRSIYDALNHRDDCCSQRPFPSTLSLTGETTTGGSQSTTTTIITGGGTDFTGDSLTGLILVESENVQAITLNASQIITNILNVNTISSFSTTELSDITFLGSTSDNKIYWDATNNIFYVDGSLKVSDSSITLNDDPDVGTLTSSDNEDKGFFFKWYDGASEQVGFMGFDISEERFKIYNTTSVTSGAITSGTLGDYQMNKVFTNNIENFDNTNFDVNVNGGDLTTIVDGGDYFLGITGGTTDIINYTNDINIRTELNTQNSLNLDSTNGGINLTSELNTVITSNNDIEMTSTNNTLNVDNFSVVTNGGIGNTMSFDDTNGLLVSDPKTDYKKWFPYSKFDFKNGIWSSIRELSGSNPVYYWSKDPVSETSYLNIDMTEAIREGSNKGLRITKIYFSYVIETDLLNSVNVIITKKTFDTLTQNITVSDVPFTNDNLLSGITIDSHYRSIDITTPVFINDDSVISLELEFNTKTTTIVKFYGMMCYFDYNNF